MTRLVVLDPQRFIQGAMAPVDILTDFHDNDVISVALPAFPLSSINTSQTYMDITSHPDGDFDGGPTDSVAFSQSTVALMNGNSEFRFPRSLLSTIDLSSVTGVRFRIQATGNCTVKIAAIRLLSLDWVYPPIDIDTLNERIERPVSLTGNPATASAFPGSTWPVIWRADQPSGSTDPKPIDLTVTAHFNSGSLTQTTAVFDEDSEPQQNVIDLYFREQPLDYTTQLDLDGSYTQADLDGLGKQPDYTAALFSSRTQAVVDEFLQSDLNALTQFDIERVPDQTSSVWLRVRVRWDEQGGTLDILDSENNGYSFPNWEFTANRDYIVFAELEDDRIRVRCYETDELGNIDFDTQIFDTGVIHDDTLIVRRKGRFGWSASLLDADAVIYNIRPRAANFAEYISAPFNSYTPVTGASLVVGGHLNRELYDGVDPSPWGGSLSLDPNKAETGTAIKVSNLANVPLQGLMTNEHFFDDFEETTIDFKIWFPKAALNAGSKLDVFLLGENIRLVPLHVTSFKTDQWDKLTFNLTQGRKIQTGYYRLVIIQTVADIPTEWWVDEISIRSRVTSWSGRSHDGSAFDTGVSPWIPFKETVNKANDGIIFSDRGKRLQVRGQARRQDARISNIKATPKYAELGRFVWAEDRQTYPTPSAFILTSTNARTVNFSVSDFDSPIRDNFDDGVIDTSLWNITGPLSEEGGALIIPSTASYNSFITDNPYDWTDQTFVFKIDTIPVSTNGTYDTYDSDMYLCDATNDNRVGFLIKQQANSPILYFYSRTATVDYFGSSDGYWTLEQYPWMRIRESGGTITWDISENGYSWITKRSVATPSFLTSAYIEGWSGWYTTDPAFSPAYFSIATINSIPSNNAVYEWSFGDGTKDFGPSVSHTYKAAGNYIVNLSIVDRHGQRTSTLTTVTVV